MNERGGAGPGGYLAILHLPRVAPVMASAIAGRLAYGMLPFSVVVAFSRQHGFAVAGVASAVLMLALAVLGPARGRLVDRHGRVALAGLGGACLILLIVTAVAVAYVAWPAAVALAGLAGATAPPISAAARTSWSRLVTGKEQLQQIHALDSVIEESTFVVAPLLTTAALHVIAARWCLIAAALLLPLSAGGLIVFGRLSASANHDQRFPTRIQRERPLLFTPAGQGIFTPVTALGAVGGGFAVLLPAAAARSGDIASAGYFLAVFSLGGVIGGLAYGRINWGVTLRVKYLAATAVLVAGVTILIPAIATPWTAAAVLIAGLAVTPIFVTAYLLVSEQIHTGRHTEANAWIGSSYNLGSAAGSAAGGLVLAHSNLHISTVMFAIAAALGTAAALRLPEATASRATPADTTVTTPTLPE
jgi:MFS family permease